MERHSYEEIRRILFDKNEAVVALKNRSGRRINFEQVFALERRKSVYCLLRPLEKVEGLGDQSVLAFSLTGNAFRAVKDKKILKCVYDAYREEILRASKGVR